MFDFPASPSSGQIFQPSANAPAWQFDGVAWKTLVTPSGMRSPTRTVFTTIGSNPYTIPVGCTAYDVEVVGGGAGGGATSSTPAAGQGCAGSGGGAGGYVKKLIQVTDAIRAATKTVFVAGGGGPGSNGGSSSYTDGINTLTASGGLAGTSCPGSLNMISYPGGVGGAATGGDINVPGSPGGSSWASGSTDLGANTAGAVGGLGAQGVWGGAGAAATWAGTTSNGSTAGSGATGWGSGGGGGSRVNTGSNVNGGGGGQGISIITEYYAGDNQVVVPGLYKLSGGVASNVATLDIALPVGYMSYELALTGIIPVNNATPLVCVFSSDGVNFSTAVQYIHGGNVNIMGTTPSNTAQGSATAATGITLCGLLGNVAYSHLHCKIPTPAAGNAGIFWEGQYYNGTNWYTVMGSGLHQGMSSAAIRAIRFLCGSGNISRCEWQLNGWK